MGRRVRFTGEEEWLEVVGVVPPLRRRTDRSSAPGNAFRPDGRVFSATDVVVRVDGGDPLDAVPVVMEAIRTADHEIAVEEIVRLDREEGEYARADAVAAAVFLSFGLGALVLAMVGVHGIVAFAVQRRAREMAIRSALGTPPRSVAWMIVRGPLGQVVLGTAVGFALGYALLPGLETMVGQEFWDDPAVIAGTLGLVLLATLTAVVGPVRHAYRRDIMDRLRVE